MRIEFIWVSVTVYKLKKHNKSNGVDDRQKLKLFFRISRNVIFRDVLFFKSLIDL